MLALNQVVFVPKRKKSFWSLNLTKPQLLDNVDYSPKRGSVYVNRFVSKLYFESPDVAYVFTIANFPTDFFTCKTDARGGGRALWLEA